MGTVNRTEFRAFDGPRSDGENTGQQPHGQQRSGPVQPGREKTRRLWRLLRDMAVRRFTWSQWRPLVTMDACIAPDWSNLSVLQPPDRRSWADPFPVRRDHTWNLFVEEKLPGAPGHIAVLELDATLQLRRTQPVLRQPFHLSYPFLLEHDGGLYMIPEAGASGRIDAYRCERFPDQWRPHATLMDNVRASDPTLCAYAGRWWLFVTMGAHLPATGASGHGPPGTSFSPDTREHLYLFYSDSPFSPTWTPHPMNPVVEDRRCARPAGNLYTMDGALYRPAQDCTRRYGYAIRIQRVTCLNTREYVEEEATCILPRRGHARAIHTFNQQPGLIVVDAKRRRPRLCG